RDRPGPDRADGRRRREGTGRLAGDLDRHARAPAGNGQEARRRRSGEYRITRGMGAQYVLECSGAPNALNEAARMVNKIVIQIQTSVREIDGSRRRSDGKQIRSFSRRQNIAVIAAAGLLFVALAFPAVAQKPGGTLRIFQYDSPASMSIHEEALNSAQNP